MNGKRPFGVSLLAIHNYAEAIWAAVVSVGIIAFPARLHFLADSPLRIRVIWGIVILFIGWLICLWARGLWRLRNWARRVEIGLSLLSLIPRGFSEISPALLVVPAGPIREILGLALTVTILLYLFSPGVRQAFGVDSTRWSWRWQVAVGILCLASAGLTLYKSKPELRAYRWHRQHGDSITVNGITFPVYQWDAPCQKCNGLAFEITSMDGRGPLVPRDPMYSITVEGYNEESDLTAEQRTEKTMLEYRKAGYRQLSRSQLMIAGQTLSCVRKEQFGRSLWCYGDGPIYHVYFGGTDAALERFNQMMAAAR